MVDLVAVTFFNQPDRAHHVVGGFRPVFIGCVFTHSFDCGPLRIPAELELDHLVEVFVDPLGIGEAADDQAAALVPDVLEMGG